MYFLFLCKRNSQLYEINFTLNNDMQGLKAVKVRGLPLEADMENFKTFMSTYGTTKSTLRDRAGTNDSRIMKKTRETISLSTSS